MEALIKTVLSMSASGTLLILLLLAAKPFLKNRVSRQWQYYIWLVVILRLLVPVGPPASLLGGAYQALDRLPGTAAAQQEQTALPAPAEDAARPQARGRGGISVQNPAMPPQDVPERLTGGLCVVWLAAALGILLYKIAAYQSFMHRLAAEAEPVVRRDLMESLALAEKTAGVKRPVELYCHPLAFSPMLVGFFRPRIILPDAAIPTENFYYTALHELTHYKRCDIFYKWLVQCTAALHWFNPFVHIMARQTLFACEFACDEAVLAKAGPDAAFGYGKTLLDAAAAADGHHLAANPVFLCGKSPRLKERLEAILHFGRAGRAARLTAAVLTVCLLLCGVFTGVYSAAGEDAAKAAGALEPLHAGRGGIWAVKDASSAPAPGAEGEEDPAQKLRQYYDAGSLPLFELALAGAEKSERAYWMRQAYRDDEIAFFSVCTRQADDALRETFAQMAYEDGSISFFSALADGMDEEDLNAWLRTALEDGRWDFQSVLYDRLGQTDKKDDADKAMDAAQREEYRAAGILCQDGEYWYEQQRVRVFLDLRPDRSFYTLSIDPEGTADLRVLRDAAGQVTGTAYLTQAELKELLGEDISA